MSPSGAFAFRFSTDEVAPRDRIAIWRELVFQSSFEVDITPAAAGPFRATATVHQLPGLRILSGTSPAATYRRAIGKIEADDIALQFGSSDDVSTSLHHRAAEIASYDAFLLPCGDRASIDVPHQSRFITLRLPRAAIAQNVADLGDTYCRRMLAGTPALCLLRRYLGLLDEVTDVLAAPELQHATVTHIYDLIAMTLGATRDAAEIAKGRGVRAARLKAIKDDIVRHLGDEALSVGAVAARHAVTPRYVQRLFEETGATFTEYVVGQRLSRAHRLVTDPRLADRTLTAIAFEVGFSDLSYFNRAFRRLFGATPSDVRAQARRAYEPKPLN
jgi:AraC-like DNA-binding protein